MSTEETAPVEHLHESEGLRAARELHDQFALGLMKLAQRHLRKASALERQIQQSTTTHTSESKK